MHFIQMAPFDNMDTILSICPPGIRPASMSKRFPPFQDNVMHASSRDETSLKMRTLRCVETSGFLCPLPQRHAPEERNPRLDRCANVKTRTKYVDFHLL